MQRIYQLCTGEDLLKINKLVGDERYGIVELKSMCANKFGVYVLVSAVTYEGSLELPISLNDYKPKETDSFEELIDN